MTDIASIITTEHADILQMPEIVSLLASGKDIVPAVKYVIAQRAFKSSDPITIKQKERAMILAPRSECVVIRGESGTGKELLAQILHGTRTGNFVAVNSTAVTETLFESELFGHVRGAFTGASETRAGLISYANEGTLFFDEIGDMPLSLQPKLLRVLQTKKFRLVGANQDQPVRCRVIAATHMNLEQMVKDGKFRLDLYQRLAVFELSLSSLRKRIVDLDLFVKDPRLKQVLWGIYTANKDTFLLGNIRELENIIKRWEVFQEI